jgi:hypothetical protein
LLLASCSFKKPVIFSVDTGKSEAAVLYGLSKRSITGLVPLSKNIDAAWVFDKPIKVPKNSSLELEYEVRGKGNVILNIEGENWQLPLDASLLTDKQPNRIRYAVPINVLTIEKIDLIVTKNADSKKAAESAIEIKALHIKKRWFGFAWEKDGFSISPFVEKAASPANSGSNVSWIVNPPLEYRIDSDLELSAFVFPETSSEDSKITVEPGTVFYEWTAPNDSGASLFLPPGMLPENPYPLRVNISGELGGVLLKASPDRPFPTPIPADSGIILSYKQGNWRDSRYEVFQWDGFPSILIFDTANYQVQERLLKRLAFFVEKKDYRGRLLTDRELDGKHGWNAHDYSAENLAAFFDTAEKERFPLSKEEEELKAILFNTGILVHKNNSISYRGGGIISLSRESSAALRQTFMAHEGFHGLFFIDQRFRDFTKERFTALSPVARNFLTSFFDYQGYDIKYQDLMINEFAGHMLQQSASQAYQYFGATIASRLEASPWRKSVLPKKDDASASWPEIGAAFQIEANAFSAYVKDRWGFAAGRNWRVRVR